MVAKKLADLVIVQETVSIDEQRCGQAHVDAKVLKAPDHTGNGNLAIGFYVKHGGKDSCAVCTQIPNCATKETCSTAGNSQCSSCNNGFYLKHGARDTCQACSNMKCPTGYRRTGTCSGTSNGYKCVPGDASGSTGARVPA